METKFIKPIETIYKGYRFRSRLEARWAVYFDALGIRWEYEAEGYETKFGKYLPDFKLPEINCLAEVKPKPFTVEEYLKCQELPLPCFLLDQPHPTFRPYYVCNASEDGGKGYSEYCGDGWYWGILSQSNYKKRLWFCLGEDWQEYDEKDAETAALSARFEFGEHGATP